VLKAFNLGLGAVIYRRQTKALQTTLNWLYRNVSNRSIFMSWPLETEQLTLVYRQSTWRRSRSPHLSAIPTVTPRPSRTALALLLNYCVN